MSSFSNNVATKDVIWSSASRLFQTTGPDTVKSFPPSKILATLVSDQYTLFTACAVTLLNETFFWEFNQLKNLINTTTVSLLRSHSLCTPISKASVQCSTQSHKNKECLLAMPCYRTDNENKNRGRQQLMQSSVATESTKGETTVNTTNR